MTTKREQRGRSAVEQFVGLSTRKPLDDSDDVREVFEEARPHSREDIMLDVRFTDDSRCAFSYAYLVKIEFEPGDTLRLIFSTETVLIEGRLLVRLYETLTQHRVRYVQEGSMAEEGLKAEESPHIETIKVEERIDE